MHHHRENCLTLIPNPSYWTMVHQPVLPMTRMILSSQCADHKVRGINGHAKATHHSTVKWHIEDDKGLVPMMVIRGAYLIPEAATRILLSQHLAQQAEDHYPKEEGTVALDDKQKHHTFLVTVALCQDSTSQPQHQRGVNHDGIWHLVLPCLLRYH